MRCLSSMTASWQCAKGKILSSSNLYATSRSRLLSSDAECSVRSMLLHRIRSVTRIPYWYYCQSYAHLEVSRTWTRGKYNRFTVFSSWSGHAASNTCTIIPIRGKSRCAVSWWECVAFKLLAIVATISSLPWSGVREYGLVTRHQYECFLRSVAL